MDKQKEQLFLVENIGKSIEERLRLSPLASRIYTLLILSSYDGLPFEAIKETIKASKSSISVNINVLMQLG
jgi:DNA-binding transcriptional regulator GbsR (MarR family)